METTRTERIKAGEIKLVPVYGEYKGRGVKLGEPARYYRTNGTFEFAECAKCGKSKHDRSEMKTATRSPEGIALLCRECDRKWASNWGSINDNKKNATARLYERLRSRTPEQIVEDRNRLRPSGEKPCKTCGQVLSFDEFYVHILEHDGLNRECKECHKQSGYARKYRSFHAWWEAQGRELSCAYCGGAFEHVDHCISRLNGGADEHSNYVPACGSCNCSKNGKWLADWYPEKYGEEKWNALQLKLSNWNIKWEL